MKPWPTDAAIIVCETPERARREFMQSVNPGSCRDCGCAIVYDSRSYRRVSEVVSDRRPPIPIAFMCMGCSKTYDINGIDVLLNHAGGKSEEYARPGFEHLIKSPDNSTTTQE